MIALKIIITLFSIIYPFAIIFFKGFSIILLAIMAILWFFRGILEQRENKKDWANFSFILAFFFSLCFILQNWGLKYLYPLLINFFLALIFYLSLKNIPMITKFAMLKEKELPEKALNYTRNLTKIWLGFFLINGLISAFLALLENKIYWGLYCGAISYILIAILVLVEITFRKSFIKNA